VSIEAVFSGGKFALVHSRHGKLNCPKASGYSILEKKTHVAIFFVSVI